MTTFMNMITFSLTPVLCLVNTRVACAQNRSEKVTFTSGDAVFAGTLAFPDGSGPHAAIVLISGMGHRTGTGHSWVENTNLPKA